MEAVAGRWKAESRIESVRVALQQAQGRPLTPAGRAELALFAVEARRAGAALYCLGCDIDELIEREGKQ